ncbi:MAG: hypothetical protein J7K98_02650 [Candidatus Aenigmarchaeota archaeon]|nr:hypothetical protein [Candidatus Aenigmarchaeota archaeon]
MKLKIKGFHIVLITLFIIIVSFIVSGGFGEFAYQNKNESENTLELNKGSDSYVYLVYSDTCPHCHHLLEYLSKIKTNVTIVKTKDSQKAYKCLQSQGFSWNFGVPIMFARTDKKLIVIEGYPSKSQDKNGYFMGMDYEYSLCNSSNGKPYYENGTYVFCEMPEGKILGNEYAVRYLINLCQKEKCKKIC